MAQVFISYSKSDWIAPDGSAIPGSPVGRVLAALEEAGVSYWIDREGLDGGVTFAERIAANIKACDIFLFLSSESANASPWTLREISTAIADGKRIIPVRLDRSDYNEAVAFYLSSVQYIDWVELGPERALQRMVAAIAAPAVDAEGIEYGKLPVLTRVVLIAALVVLTGLFALLTYFFLWATTIQSSEVIGGLAGYVGEFALLTSIYYVLRLLRRRKSYFLMPLVAIGVVLAAGLLGRRVDFIVCDALLILGWLAIYLVCLYHTPRRESLFRQMSKEDVLLRINDPENLILVYLAVKALIVVAGHFFDGLTDLSALMGIFN
ncbi:MAG: toll/interleukin-1 receptor domain-containing protein [Bacteroidales bacterium]|nr:toll/interleukin-1 receptor domain-containing protein [Bacteroidales bacterium]